MRMSTQLKKKMLKLLEEDAEFRYAVAGYLGYSEILKNIEKVWMEIKALREGQERLWDGQNKLWENTNRLWESVNRLWENTNKLWEEVRNLREGQERIWQNVDRLWENTNRLWEEVRDIRLTLDRVAVTVDRLTISIEEEALSYIRYRLRNELGIEVSLDRLFIDTKEVNVYGAVGEYCIIGEATVRLGVGLVGELLEKIKTIKSKRPDLLKQKLIKVIYTDYATPDALDYARENKVWVLKWSGDLTPIAIEEASQA